jgi:cytochrome c-type biogenesis protein
MNLNPNIILSFTAGLLSFLSPCVFPLIPSYISFLSGVSLKDLIKGRYKRSSVFFHTLAFVIGFLLVFSIIGILIFGTFFSLHNQLGFLDIIAGVIVIVFGLNFIFNFLKILNIERRFEIKHKTTGFLGSLLVGMAFGAGWTPCIGPLLQSIFLLTAATETTLFGLLNMLFFSLGLGLPFLLISIFFPFILERLNRFKKLLPLIRMVSGIFLVGMGLFILSGRIATINFYLMMLAGSLKKWKTASALTFNLTGAFIFFGLSFLILIPFLKRSLKNREEKKLQISMPVICFSIVFLLLGILQLFGVFNFLDVIASWLSSN